MTSVRRSIVLVLIPLNSGHQSGLRRELSLQDVVVLIPLNSGHQSGPSCGRPEGLECLNPFEFRASVRTSTPTNSSAHSCLNPFEFRASVRTVRKSKAALRADVLIPLNSGHQSGQGRSATPSWTSSLNPFEFRASVRTRWLETFAPLVGLNPFEFRASVRTRISSTC